MHFFTLSSRESKTFDFLSHARTNQNSIRVIGRNCKSNRKLNKQAASFMNLELIRNFNWRYLFGIFLTFFVREVTRTRT